MKMIVAAPSLNRPKHVERFKELFNMHGSKNAELFLDIQEEPNPLTKIINELVAISTIEFEADIVMLLADYVEIGPNTISSTLEIFEQYGTDIAVGLKILNMEPLENVREFCFMALGADFINRFEQVQYQVFCPDYYHFYGDTELGLYAKSINKFILNEEGVTINHPNAGNAQKDSTYFYSREMKHEDKEINSIRRNKNLLWGKDFTRIANYGNLNPNC